MNFILLDLCQIVRLFYEKHFCNKGTNAVYTKLKNLDYEIKKKKMMHSSCFVSECYIYHMFFFKSFFQGLDIEEMKDSRASSPQNESVLKPIAQHTKITRRKNKSANGPGKT